MCHTSIPEFNCPALDSIFLVKKSLGIRDHGSVMGFHHSGQKTALLFWFWPRTALCSLFLGLVLGPYLATLGIWEVKEDVRVCFLLMSLFLSFSLLHTNKQVF